MFRLYYFQIIDGCLFVTMYKHFLGRQEQEHMQPHCSPDSGRRIRRANPRPATPQPIFKSLRMVINSTRKATCIQDDTMLAVQPEKPGDVVARFAAAPRPRKAAVTFLKFLGTNHLKLTLAQRSQRAPQTSRDRLRTATSRPEISITPIIALIC